MQRLIPHAASRDGHSRAPGGLWHQAVDPDLLTSSNFNFCTVETDELGQDAINNFQRRFLEEIGQGLFELTPDAPTQEN